MEIALKKDIAGYEGLYQIDTNGIVYSLETETKNYCILKPFLVDGYPTVKLSKGERIDRKQYSVHRLVAIAFIPNPYNKPQVNHIDKNRGNNCVDNLEWVTVRENQTHSISLRNNSSRYTGVSWNKWRQQWSSQIGVKGKIINLGFFPEEEAAAWAYRLKMEELKISNKYAIVIEDPNG